MNKISIFSLYRKIIPACQQVGNFLSAPKIRSRIGVARELIVDNITSFGRNTSTIIGSLLLRNLLSPQAIFLLPLLLCLTALTFFSTNDANAKIVFQSDFESGGIDLNTHYPFSQYRITDDKRGGESNLTDWGNAGNGVVRSPVRSGKYAVKFNLTYDPEKIYVKHQLNPENFDFQISKEYWVGFSVFFPSDWKTDTQELVFQCHGKPDFSLGETWRSPPLSFSIDGDSMFWRNRWDPKPVTIDNNPRPEGGSEKIWIGSMDSSNKGRWIDFVLNIKWSYESDGFLKIWKDGKVIVDRKGPNSYNDRGGVKGPLFGIYKWTWQKKPSNVTQRIVYHDEVRVGDASSSYNEVSPPNSTVASNMCTLDSKFTASTLSEGMTYYTDRSYTLTRVPSKYIGMDMIKTPNDEKDNTASSDYLEFTLAQNTTVYVAYSSEALSLPSWMNGFTDTGDNITTMNLQEKTFDVYSKSFPAGCVNLGANKASGFTGGSINNYMVFYETDVTGS